MWYMLVFGYCNNNILSQWTFGNNWLYSANKTLHIHTTHWQIQLAHNTQHTDQWILHNTEHCSQYTLYTLHKNIPSGLAQRWACSLARVSITGIPPCFFSLDIKTVISKVSIPVSISRLKIWKSRFQSRYQDSVFKSLDSSLDIKTRF